MLSDDKSRLQAVPPEGIEETVTKAKKAPWKAKTIGIFFLTIFILLSAAAFLRVWMLSQELSASLSHFSQQTELEQQQLLALQDRWAGIEKRLQIQEQALQHQMQATQEARTPLENGLPRQDYDKVLEAQFWVQMANAELVLMNDLPRALRLLNQAQAEIDGLNSPIVLPLKQSLAEDVSALKSVPVVNATELYLRLTTLEQQIASLPLVRVAAPTVEASTLKSPGGLEHSFEALRQIVVVYHLPKANTPPFITPDQQPYIYQNCHALLSEAAFAVLHRDLSVYHSALQQASEWIRQYFLVSAPETQKVLSELNALQSLARQPTKEVILLSPKAFQDYLQK